MTRRLSLCCCSSCAGSTGPTVRVFGCLPYSSVNVIPVTSLHCLRSLPEVNTPRDCTKVRRNTTPLMKDELDSLKWVDGTCHHWKVDRRYTDSNDCLAGGCSPPRITPTRYLSISPHSSPRPGRRSIYYLVLVLPSRLGHSLNPPVIGCASSAYASPPTLFQKATAATNRRN